MRKRLIRIIIEQAVFSLIVALITALVIAYPAMLALGALHSQWYDIPAFGWWTTYLIAVALSLVMDMTKTGSSSRES